MSPPVYVMSTLIGLHPSVTVYVYITVQLQLSPDTCVFVSVAVGVLQLSPYNNAIDPPVGAEGLSA